MIGTAFGGSGDKFNLPDLRGCFLRGVDVQPGAPGGPRDPDSGKRVASAAGGNEGNAVGSFEADALQGHEHQYTTLTAAGTAQAGEVPSLVTAAPATETTTSDVADQTPDGTPRVSSETRPVNLYLNFIIRYR